MVAECVQAASSRSELGPVDVLKVCQGRWPVYFAQSSSTLHRQVEWIVAQCAAAK